VTNNAHAIRRSVLGIAFALTMAAEAIGADLTVTVLGVRSDRGQIALGLYEGAASWPDGTPAFQIDLPAAPATLSYVFKDLPQGRYALSGFHDENANGRFDTGFLGLPREGFIFSRDRKPRFSSPGFEACAIDVGAAGTHITVSVQYWPSAAP